MKEDARRSLPGRPWSRRLGIGLWAAILGSWLPAVAWACPVCYGEAEGGVVDGARMAIVFMAVLVYALIGGGIGMVIALRRRARRLQKERDPRRGLHLVHPEPSAVAD